MEYRSHEANRELLEAYYLPFLFKKHDHGLQPGHHIAGYAEVERGVGIVVGGRTFIPANATLFTSTRSKRIDSPK